MRKLYRHSVWIDVFGVVLFGAVLLGGAVYLLYHAGSAAGGLGGGASGGGAPAVAQGQTGGGARLAQRPGGLASPRPGTGPLLGSRSGPVASGAQAPFSADWRERATPDLTGPSAASSGADPRGGGLGSASSGPPIASSRPSGELGRGSTYESETGGSSWRAEARQFAGRARVLSRQLGQMAQDAAGRERASSKEAPSKGEAAVRSAAAGGAKTSSGPGTPDNPDRRDDSGSPSDVPIDDHVYWLAVAGVLWGIWRLHGGG